MSQWWMWVVDPWGKRLTEPDDDILITGWRWEKNEQGEYDLVAEADFQPQHCIERGVAHAFLLTNADNGRVIHSTMFYDRTVDEFTKVLCSGISVTGDLIYLIEEYLPSRPK